MRIKPVLVAATLLALVPAAPAVADFAPAGAIDGPSPDVLRVADFDMARDGTGIVAYVRRENGVERVVVSRLVNGVWSVPERVDAGLETPSPQAAVAVADGGRYAVAFTSGGVGYTTVRPADDQPWTAPAPMVELASDPSIDMSIHGAAYATFTANGDVRAARLNRKDTAFGVLPDALDIDPANAAGVGTGRSRVAVGADGTGLVAWGEAGHVYSRRLFGAAISQVPADLTVPELDGHAGIAADAPDVGIEDDSSFAWVVFRQRFDNGGPQQDRAVARRLRGSRYEEPVIVDAQAWGGENVGLPDIGLSGRGEGVASVGTTASGAASAAVLKDDAFFPAAPVGGDGIPPQPRGATAETLKRVVAWMQGPAGAATVQARLYDDEAARRTQPAPGAPATLSLADAGPVDPNGGLAVGGDRLGDTVAVFVQAGPDGRRLMAGTYDRAPGSFSTFTGSAWRATQLPTLAWGPSLDLLGGVTYQVQVGGATVGQTTDTKLQPSAPLPDGEHQWRVVAVDRTGQTFASRSRLLRIDGTPPKVSFKVRRAGARATVTTTASDAVLPNVKASGIARVRIDFGDGTVVTGKRAEHRFGRKGRFTIRVSATDKAGNATAVTREVRVR